MIEKNGQKDRGIAPLPQISSCAAWGQNTQRVWLITLNCSGRSYPESGPAVAKVIAAKMQPMRNRYMPTGCGVLGNGFRQQHVLFSTCFKHDLVVDDDDEDCG